MFELIYKLYQLKSGFWWGVTLNLEITFQVQNVSFNRHIFRTSNGNDYYVNHHKLQNEVNISKFVKHQGSYVQNLSFGDTILKLKNIKSIINMY